MIVTCFENCHETITFTNKPQNFVISFNLTKLCTAQRCVLPVSFPVDQYASNKYFCFTYCINLYISICIQYVGLHSNFTSFYFINTKDIFFACLCHRSCWMLFLTHMWQRGLQPLPQPRRQQPYQCQAQESEPIKY